MPATWKRPVAVVEHDVVDGRLQQVGGPLAGRVDQLGRWRSATAAPPSCTERDPTVSPPERTTSVSPWTHLDLVDRHAGAVGHDHRPRGVVALAVRRRAAAHPEPAAVEQLDGAELGARARRR